MFWPLIVTTFVPHLVTFKCFESVEYLFVMILEIETPKTTKQKCQVQESTEVGSSRFIIMFTLSSQHRRRSFVIPKRKREYTHQNRRKSRLEILSKREVLLRFAARTNTSRPNAKSKQKITLLYESCSQFHQFFTGALPQVCLKLTIEPVWQERSLLRAS